MSRSATALIWTAVISSAVLSLAASPPQKAPVSARASRLGVEHALRNPQDPAGFAHGPEILTVGGDALFVVGNTSPLSTGDTAVKNRLESLGFTLTIKSASSALESDAGQKALVFISSSASATQVNTKFRDAGVPVVVAQKDIFDEMKMTGTTNNTHFGSTGSQTQVVISNASHPLAGGLTGTVTVATSSTFAWGQVNTPPGAKAATIVGQSSRAAVFGYEPGDTMVGLAAPARRVGFFLSSNTFNTNGWTLFDAAVTWASNKVSAPYFSPWGGVFPHTELPTVEMFTDTPGAQIRYTTDNTTPTVSSPLYTAPIPITATTTLEARAFLSGWAPSDPTSDTYQVTFGTVADPVLTPNGGSAVDSIVASITAEPGAAIHYTTDGSEPQEWSQAYSGALTFTTNADLRARAFKTDWTPSGAASAFFQVRPPTPTINLAAGTYALGQTTTVTANGATVTLRYSINGNDPTESDPVIASGGSIPVGAFTLKVNAWRPGCTPSTTAQATYDVTGRLNNGAVAAGSLHSLALRPDGTVLQWGSGIGNTPRLVNGLSGVTGVAAGGGQSVAVKTDGTVWTWSAGVLPTQKAGLANVVKVSAGTSHTLALDASGNLWSWGDNTFGQLGNGTTTASTTPVQLTSLTGVVAFSAGGTHNLAVASGGQAWAWGNNADRRLGDGTAVAHQTAPVQVKNSGGTAFAGVASVSAGGAHSFAVKADGSVYSWGSNQNGGLGVGQSSGTLAFSAHPLSLWIVAPRNLATGSAHTIVASSNSSLLAWGANSSGQVGNGTTTTQNSPVLVMGSSNALQVAAGSAHSLALLADGTVLAWGSNGQGQLGDGSFQQRTSPVTVQQWSFGAPAAAPVIAPPTGTYPAPLAVTLSAEPGAQIYYTTDGSTPTMGTFASTLYSAPFNVTTNGTVKAIAWRPDANLSSVSSAAYTLHAAMPDITPAGGTFSAATVPVTVTCATASAQIRYTYNGVDPTINDPAITSGGTLILTGSGTLKAKAWMPGPTAPGPVRTETYVINGTPLVGTIAAGSGHSLARDSSSTAWAWGYNGSGQLGDGTQQDRWSPTQVQGLAPSEGLSAGGALSAALDEGEVWSWGANTGGALGDGSTGFFSVSPVAATGLSSMSAVSAGGSHKLALKSDGTLWSWGQNLNGQLGDGTTDNRNVPGAVSGLTGVTITKVAAGESHSLALDQLGRVWAWGRNQEGQLGDNSTTQRNSPVLLSAFGGSAVVAIAAGQSHSLAVTTGGQVYAWGYNLTGQLGDGTTTTRLVPTLVTSLSSVSAVSAGGGHSLALQPTGVVWSWGYGAFVGDGANQTRLTPVRILASVPGVVQISAGNSHGLALAHDGSVWAWGSNGSGQLGDGTTTTRLLPVRVSGPNFTWQVGPPVFDPPIASTLGYPSDLAVTVTSSTAGATIRFTLNGIDPTEADAVVASGSTVTLSQSATLKAKAWASDVPPSPVVTATYILKPSTPQVQPGGTGTFLVGQAVTVTSANPSATVRYRTDGQEVTESDSVWVPVHTLQDTIALRVRAFKSGWSPSDTASANMTAKAPAPGISLATGSYEGAQMVTLTTSVTSSRIHYTTSGVLPTASDPFVTSGGTVTIDRSSTLRARVWRETWALGDVASADYFLTLGPVATPVFDPPAGSYSSPQSVAVTSATPGATIRYTLNGTEPTARSSIYTGAISVDGSMTVKAKAFRVDHLSSTTGTASYTIALATAAPPLFSVPSGTYVREQTVTASSATAGSTIRYTIDGTDPDAADAIVPPIGLRVTGATNLKARAFKDGLPPSPVRQAGYWIVGMADAGSDHSGVLRADGSLWTWGRNSWGQLGHGNFDNRTSPARLYGTQQWAAVSAGSYHTLGLDIEGRVWSWGDNVTGRLGDGTNITHIYPVLVPTLTGVVAISAAENHSLALKDDGTVWSWGHNTVGQLGVGTTGAPSSVPVQVVGLHGITRIVASHDFSLALKTDGAGSGTVFMWGQTGQGQLGDGSVSGAHPPDRTTPAAVLHDVVGMEAGVRHSVAWKADGTLWRWGIDLTFVPSPTQVAGISPAVSASAGDTFTVSLGATGTAMAWGINTNGELGRGTVTGQQPTPAPVLVLDEAVAISSSYNYSLAVRRDGSIMGWGYNGWGQVGVGAPNNQTQPVLVPFPNPLVTDVDGDGLLTALEAGAGCDPLNPDTNSDGLLDGAAVAAGVSCSDLDLDDDGVQNLLERTHGTDPFRADTDDDGSNDQADCFPLDPTRWVCPTPDPNDHTPPIITLTSPTNATLISSVP